MELEDNLRSMGFANIETCFTLDVGIINSRRNEFDVIFIDVNLCGWSAIPVIEKLLQAHQSIVVTTGTTLSKELRTRLGSLYLCKPYSTQQLFLATIAAMQWAWSETEQ